MVLEVMGRDAGHIALSAGIGGGADVILVPEIDYTIENVVKKIKNIKKEEGRNFSLIVVSEAVKTLDGSELKKEYHGGERRYAGIGNYIGEQISDKADCEARVTVLGHVQRGCAPVPDDRILASAFGVHAIELVEQGKFDRMVSWSDRKVIDVPIEDAIAAYQAIDLDGTLVKTARSLGICLGDE